MTSQLKVLLLTAVDLQSSGVGSLFLRDLMAAQKGISFLVHEEKSFLAQAPGGNKLLRLVPAGAARIGGFGTARLRVFRRAFLWSRVRTIAARARHDDVDCIWLTASSPELIWIGEALAEQGFDIRTTVWDAPEYLAQNLRLAPDLIADLIASFGNLLRRSAAVSVIGQAMRRRYQSQYDVKPEVIRHGVDVTPVARTARDDAEIRIVFAGSLYSKQEWNSFVSALEAANWRVHNRRVSLTFVGRFPLTGAIRSERITFLGEKLLATQ